MTNIKGYFGNLKLVANKENEKLEGNEKINNVVYVGNINKYLRDETMKKLLNIYGNVNKWQRQKNPTTGEFMTFGLCEFDNIYSVYLSCTILNHVELFGKNLKVNCHEQLKNKFANMVDILYNERKKQKTKTKKEKEIETDIEIRTVIGTEVEKEREKEREREKEKEKEKERERERKQNEEHETEKEKEKEKSEQTEIEETVEEIKRKIQKEIEEDLEIKKKKTTAYIEQIHINEKLEEKDILQKDEKIEKEKNELEKEQINGKYPKGNADYNSNIYNKTSKKGQIKISLLCKDYSSNEEEECTKKMETREKRSSVENPTKEYIKHKEECYANGGSNYSLRPYNMKKGEYKEKELNEQKNEREKGNIVEIAPKGEANNKDKNEEKEKEENKRKEELLRTIEKERKPYITKDYTINWRQKDRLSKIENKEKRLEKEFFRREKEWLIIEEKIKKETFKEWNKLMSIQKKDIAKLIESDLKGEYEEENHKQNQEQGSEMNREGSDISRSRKKENKKGTRENEKERAKIRLREKELDELDRKEELEEIEEMKRKEKRDQLEKEEKKTITKETSIIFNDADTSKKEIDNEMKKMKINEINNIDALCNENDKNMQNEENNNGVIFDNSTKENEKLINENIPKCNVTENKKEESEEKEMETHIEADIVNKRTLPFPEIVEVKRFNKKTKTNILNNQHDINKVEITETNVSNDGNGKEEDITIKNEQNTKGEQVEKKIHTMEIIENSKKILEKVPNTENDIINFPIEWKVLNLKNNIVQKLKPWIYKKITEYIGQEEKDLIEEISDYFVQQIIKETPPKEMIIEAENFLDSEGKKFILNMYKLIIFEQLKIKDSS